MQDPNTTTAEQVALAASAVQQHKTGQPRSTPQRNIVAPAAEARRESPGACAMDDRINNVVFASDSYDTGQILLVEFSTGELGITLAGVAIPGCRWPPECSAAAVSIYQKLAHASRDDNRVGRGEREPQARSATTARRSKDGANVSAVTVLVARCCTTSQSCPFYLLPWDSPDAA